MIVERFVQKLLPQAQMLQREARDFAHELGPWDYLKTIPYNWGHQIFHNGYGLLAVADLIWVRKVQSGIIGGDHPFMTGIDPATGKTIWNSNVVFRTPRRDDWGDSKKPPESDEVMIERVGEYLRGFTLRAASTPEHPRGLPSRMPPAVLYIHGPVHYHSGYFIFNDFKEAIRHFSDPRFVREYHRFVKEEKREPLLVFRERDYDKGEYEDFVGFIRTVLPWFSNSAGPRPVLWGAPSPYAVVVTITGHWIADTHRFLDPRTRDSAPRPPIPQGRYFLDGPYHGRRQRPYLPEKMLGRLTRKRIQLRGEKAEIYFTDKREIRRGVRYGG